MAARTSLPVLLALLLVFLSSGCMSLEYDLAEIPIPVSAKPAEPGAGQVEQFRIEVNNVLWVHGLFGRDQPDVAALVANEAHGHDRIAGFRVRQQGSFHGWLAAHLSLTLVRMRTVVIEGQLVRDPEP